MQNTSNIASPNNSKAKQKGSEILAIAYEVQQLMSEGKRVANFTIGDFDPTTFHIPIELQNFIFAHYNARHTNYPQAMGAPELRKAICEFYKHRLGLNFEVSNIAVGSGVRPLLYAAFQTIIEEGDAVIFAKPSWNTKAYVKLSGAVDCAITTLPENNFLLTADQIRPHIRNSTIIALCSPANPTGTMFERQQLLQICELLLEENLRRKSESRKPCYLIYDQVYSLFAYEQPHFHPCNLLPDLSPYAIYVDGMSKSFAATGVRVGWCAGPAEVVPAISNLIGYIGAWAPKPEQLASAQYLTLFKEQDEYLAVMRDKMSKRLKLLFNAIKEMKAEGLPIDCLSPQGGMFISIHIDVQGMITPEGSVLDNPNHIRQYILHQGNCAFIPFYAFDTEEAPTWFRASVSSLSDDDIQWGIDSLRLALKQLKS